MFLVVVDAHTKWIEVVPMSNSTSFGTIQQLRTLFAQFGIPRIVVTDNGPCFISEEFREFMTRNGIHHIRSSPYHPASNGLTERAVHVFKEGFKKMKEGTISDKIARFLFLYRNLPHSTTGVSPAELMFGRQLRSRLDLLKPSLESRVEHNQQRQKEGHDQHACERQFSVSDSVYVRNFGQGEVWFPGVISEVTGPVSYMIELMDGSGRTVRQHWDHVQRRHDMLPETLLVPEQIVELDLFWRIRVMHHMCNRILIQPHLSPNQKSRNDVIRCARDTPLRDSCDSHLWFPLRGEECAECDDCACFIM